MPRQIRVPPVTAFLLNLICVLIFGLQVPLINIFKKVAPRARKLCEFSLAHHFNKEESSVAYRLLNLVVAHEVERGAQLVATNHEEKRQ